MCAVLYKNTSLEQGEWTVNAPLSWLVSDSNWVHLLCFPLCLLYFRAPFRQQTDSAVEKNTEGISASTPLGVITNRAILSSANGIANAGAASTTGKDFSAEEARERRRLVSRVPVCVSPPLWSGLTWWWWWGCKNCFLGATWSYRLLPLLHLKVLNWVITGL